MSRDILITFRRMCVGNWASVRLTKFGPKFFLIFFLIFILFFFIFYFGNWS